MPLLIPSLSFAEAFSDLLIAGFSLAITGLNRTQTRAGNALSKAGISSVCSVELPAVRRIGPSGYPRQQHRFRGQQKRAELPGTVWARGSSADDQLGPASVPVVCWPAPPLRGGETAGTTGTPWRTVPEASVLARSTPERTHRTETRERSPSCPPRSRKDGYVCPHVVAASAPEPAVAKLHPFGTPVNKRNQT